MLLPRVEHTHNHTLKGHQAYPPLQKRRLRLRDGGDMPRVTQSISSKVRVQTQAFLMPTPLTATPDKLPGRAEGMEQRRGCNQE